MKKLLLGALLFLGLACGKKEWPQPIAAKEAIFIDHLEARLNQGCIQLNAKVGGNLHNLEFFMVEVEEDGCPTCPFQATFTQKIYPYDAQVRQLENSYVITLCQPFASPTLRLRIKAENTLTVIDPAISEVLTLGSWAE